jgi:hypothetical protein
MIRTPRARQPDTYGSTVRGRPGIYDERSVGQRWHDAFADLITRATHLDGLPASGGTPATVIVTINYDDLVSRTGHGVTTDGTPLSTAAILKLADEALVLPTVLTSSGAVLTMGRSCRIATRPQTMALVARDGGCTFPGCDHPAEWCQRHHIKGWIDGGPTDLNNLTLVCGYHHRSFEHNGWTCTMINGLPHWTPPAWTDPRPDPDPPPPPPHATPHRGPACVGHGGTSQHPGAASKKSQPEPRSRWPRS